MTEKEKPNSDSVQDAKAVIALLVITVFTVVFWLSGQ